jgi:hypothetical protein
MILARLYLNSTHRVGDTNDNNQAGLARFLVAKLPCAPATS